eukprot:Amastigsp_a2111_31.p4 type:complete len:180 gc:universal Amastigsp_a2111_31:592-53(-)
MRVLRDQPCAEEPARSADGNRRKEDGKPDRALLGRRNVVDHGGRDAAETGLANADQRARNKKLRIRVGESGEQSSACPTRKANREKVGRAHRVNELSKDGRRNHKPEHEHRAEEPAFCCGEMELVLEGEQKRRDCASIVVRDQIDHADENKGHVAIENDMLASALAFGVRVGEASTASA